jgi:hypothetical protein
MTDSIIGPVTDNLINSFVDEVKKKKNRDKIMKNIVTPILNDIEDRYLPYVLTLATLFVVQIVLLLLLLFTKYKC